MLITEKEIGGIVFEEIELSSNGFCFARSEAADTKVRMDAANDALEEFLVGFPGGGKEPFVVGADTANESV